MTANKAFIQKWIAALRSGEYKQGKIALLQDGHYCCLGVAADLLEKDGEAPQRPWRSARVGVLSMPFPGKLSRTTENRLWIMNDDGVPFPEIADYIEREILPKAPA